MDPIRSFFTGCAALLALAGCAKTTGPDAGSQTHFLECDRDQDCESLGSQFSCEAGICRDQSEPPPGGSGAMAQTGSRSQIAAGSGAQAGTGSQLSPELCDGSTDLRFGYDASGGFIDSLDEFHIRFGYFFFYVQGNCHFIASRFPTGEIREGKLEADRARQLASAVSFTKLSSWTGFDDSESCADAGELGLLGPAGRVTCTCGCGEDAPDGMEEAFSAASMVMDELWPSATPIEGPVTAAAYPQSKEAGTWSGPVTPQAWPLASSLDDILVAERENIDASSGMRFEGADAEALRTLRSQALKQEQYSNSFPIRDADGKLYLLLVRDELDSELQAALEAFR